MDGALGLVYLTTRAVQPIGCKKNVILETAAHFCGAALLDWNSVTHSSVSSRYCWPYKPTDKLKSSPRHSEVFIPPVIESSVV